MIPALFAVALADVPPPKGYVESCTVANHGKDTCKTCRGWHGGREDCEALEEQGYVSMCKTRGASVWSEVMCGGRPGPNSPQPVAPVPSVSGPVVPVPSPAPTKEKPSPTIAEAEPSPAPAPNPTPMDKSEPAETSRCSSLGAGSVGVLPWLALLGLRRR